MGLFFSGFYWLIQGFPLFFCSCFLFLIHNHFCILGPWKVVNVEACFVDQLRLKFRSRS